ncbi:hypothetical protein [Pelomicrobium methylotrophicum]|uniref:Uncharacterized protein n=1 Tax=Pelomicrobium methylotrophicum TaxID=2602750 RepID=A0A5C7EVC6_9PROT|nr:hypothetical protein [Pelomicrobium methylotrophicum]TXF12045.1 hypothetical protein FR698_07285 [Pelomicrobium methylotrophicum]
MRACDEIAAKVSDSRAPWRSREAAGRGDAPAEQLSHPGRGGFGAFRLQAGQDPLAAPASRDDYSKASPVKRPVPRLRRLLAAP